MTTVPEGARAGHSSPAGQGQGDRPPDRPRVGAPRRRVTAADGLLLVDKDQGWTSHDVVARVRRLAATKKVGHAGTLDPMATGLLVLGIGRATRLLTYLVGADKEYTATVRLGQGTITDDAEGEVTAEPGVADLLDATGAVDEARLEVGLAGLRGTIQQVPSAVSAIKVDGRRSYARVRAGEDVELPAREISVLRFDLTGPPRRAQAGPTPVIDLDVVVECSSGTYVRALARDLGAALGTAGHLTALRRTRVGPFAVDAARTVTELADEIAAQADDVEPAGLAVTGLTEAATACFPVRRLTAEEARAVAMGQFLDPTGAGERPVAAIAPEGHVIALLQDRSGRARPVLVLAPA